MQIYNDKLKYSVPYIPHVAQLMLNMN